MRQEFLKAKTVTLEEMYPLISEQLSCNGTVTFTIHGISMTPMLRDGTDSVRISKADTPLKKYDIPFYRRADGSFILHRIVKVKDDGYVCRGDHQLVDEYPVTDSMVIGILTAYNKSGKWISVNSWRHRLYSRFWVSTYFFRKAGYRICRRLKNH